MTYLLGKRAPREGASGLVAALALALTYAHVVTGQWVKEDVPAAFFHTAATLLLVSAVITKARVKDSMSGGFLGGLGMATKYYSVGLLIPAAFAHLFPAKASRSARCGDARRAARDVLRALPRRVLRRVARINFLRPDFFDAAGAARAEARGPARRIERRVRRDRRRSRRAASGSSIARPASRSSTPGAPLVESLYIPDGIGLVFFILAVGGLVLALVRHRGSTCSCWSRSSGQAALHRRSATASSRSRATWSCSTRCSPSGSRRRSSS